MSRKKATRAADEDKAAKAARWRYLVRNPDFVRELRALAGLRDPHVHDALVSLKEEGKFADKWAVYVHEEVIRALVGNPDIGLESFTDQMSSEAAVVIETERDVYYPDPEMDPGESSLVTGRAVFIRVDITHPVDTLLPLIERELRAFAKADDERLASEPELKRTLSKVAKSRRRLDRVDFQLSVFDLAQEGHAFKTIARRVRRPESSVKSAYLRASRNVFGLGSSRPKPPSKKHLPLAAFNPDDHSRSCAECRQAGRFEEMCEKAKRYALQDHVAQRESPQDTA